MTMTITLNGNPKELESRALLPLISELLGKDITDAGTAADGSALGIAVAVNHTVIPRGRWATHTLAEADSVEIVTAVQGG